MTETTALVTGGSGFLGSHLCESLLDAGHKVICFDNLLTGRLSNIDHLLGSSRFEFREGNVTEYLKFTEDIDFLLHFASPASPKDYFLNPIHTLKVGALGTHNALGLARAKGARFLLASTSEVYGDPLESPQKENYWGNVNPVGPRSVYDEAKRFAEAIVMAYHREHGLDTRIVRIFNTYGPRMRPQDGRALPNFVTQALRGDPLTVYGNGSQTRSFCYIDDLVEGINKMLDISSGKLDAVSSRVINIGNPEEITILQMAKAVKETLSSESRIVFEPLPEDDPMVRRPDISVAIRTLDWQPKISFAEGLARTIDYFRSTGS